MIQRFGDFSHPTLYFSADEKTISYTYQIKTTERGLNSSIELKNVVYKTISANELEGLDVANVPSKIDAKVFYSSARGVGYKTIRFNPIIKKGNTYQKVVSYTFPVPLNRTSTQLKVENKAQAISNSVLAEGTWRRFYVEENGIQRIDRGFLSNLGYNVGTIDPSKIKIYSYGGRMMPYLNSDNLFYDIPQLSIEVVGGNDGSFDSGDYILFYGESTRGYNPEFKTHVNAYTDRAYYYIRVEGDNGKRVTPYNEPIGIPQHVLTSFTERQFYESDEENPAKAGRRWIGDRFDIQSERTYSFDFANLVPNSTMRVIPFTASASNGGSHTISVDGQELITVGYGNSLANFKDTNPISIPGKESFDITLTYNNEGNPSNIGYLDFLAVEAQRQLRSADKQLIFSNEEVETLSGIGEYRIEDAQNISAVWDITSPYSVSAISNTDNSSLLTFNAPMGTKKLYAAIEEGKFFTPRIDNTSQVSNQNLKGTIFNNGQGGFEDIDYLVITSQELKAQAERLAQHRAESDNLTTRVVTLDQIYHEFGPGAQDIVAIRNFVKYVYDNASGDTNRLKYLCLFGDTSLDYKNRLRDNNNIVPTYHAFVSNSGGAANFMSDDFFGMMDAQEGRLDTENSVNKLDIAVGRILADTPQLAKEMVDKIIAYETEPSYGRWRNNFVLISDDVDEVWEHSDIQVELDSLGDDLSLRQPFINVYKIHSDAFLQESSAGGDRYPRVNEAIANAVEVGASVINYFGHGGEDGLAKEFIVTKGQVQDYSNTNKYNLLITVTCEFTRFDNPLRKTAGEYNYWNPQGGSIAMITTTRTIDANNGDIINDTLARYLFNYDNNLVLDTAAESFRKAKVELSSRSKRVLFFVGDPALKIAFPKPEIQLTAINDSPITNGIEQIKALDKVKISGNLVNSSGQVVTNYNGTLETTIFDKRIARETLANDNVSNGGNVLKLQFTTLGNIIYRGQASITNGLFDFEFVVPKDIQLNVGKGRISFYAKREGVLEDQRGYNNDILIGGLNENAPEDNIGPEIELFMNYEGFVSGGITNESPFIIAKLSDENGINTTGGVGHDLIAYLDGDESNPYVVNDYYESNVDDFTKGTVSYKLRDIEPGLHTLTFRAWDTYNNSATSEIQFVVADDQGIKVEHVLNYPNPFTSYTEFWFDHNRPFEPLEVQVQVFTVSGKIVWSRNQTIVSEGRSRDITWDGRDDFGSRIGKGVYVYKLTVRSTLTNKKTEKYEKLVIL
ncbi:type IX secretion system sortase PorU [Gangjinia marincola]|uniref:Type IX secretion system sortase PorU n=2 Tax=Gangjinia marincola TaxID=578463 RepID=A0ABN1MK25_9FLAO